MLALRAYHEADRTACWHVFFRAVHEGAAGFYTPEQRQAWAPRQTVPDGPDKLLTQHCIVAERAGRIVGFMSLTDAGYLDMAFVLPEEMGKGTAAALHDAVITHATDTGLAARVTTHASHLFRRFLLRQGWQVVAAETVERDGERLDRFVMDRVLPTGDARATA